MSFNFNWEPLFFVDDSASPNKFYEKAKELLTAALNKPSKPPIIVDDIVVSDLNLGKKAPRLDVLEIGDIASDRFRGVFKMSYNGDACIKLSTKVQVNPLHTYLSTTPNFISPTPLAASSPLTIPIQITLSDFLLDGFVILVFSKAKGITIVFRNDPLESLRVTSTFDSIPYIKEYLQKEIERQVRGLFQEELPVAIHKLSLRLWNPDYAAREHEMQLSDRQFLTASTIDCREFFTGKEGVDGSSLEDSNQVSQKNMAQLSSLRFRPKTLSLSLPSIPNVLHRAWVGGMSSTTSDETADGQAMTLSETGEEIPVAHTPSYTAGLSVGARNPSTSSMHGRQTRKKRRVINLRGLTTKTDSQLGGETMSSALADDGRTRSRSEIGSPVVSELNTSSPGYAGTPSRRVESPVLTPAVNPSNESYSEEAIRNRILEKALLAKLANEFAKQAHTAGEASSNARRKWSFEDVEGVIDLPRYRA